MTTKSAPKPSPLGRGLSALFGDADASYQPRASVSTVAPAALVEVSGKKTPGVFNVSIELLQPGEFQPRRRFDEDVLKELAESIRERGVLQPLLVRPIMGEQNSYEIVAGERRWRAAQMAGAHEVPVVVRNLTDKEAMEIGLIENVQRQGLSLLEEAEGYKRLLEEFGHTQEGLSKVVGKSRSYMANIMRLLTLPDAVKAYIDKGDLSMGHARALVSARNPIALAEETVKRGWSVRRTEEAVRREGEKKNNKKNKTSPETDGDVLALEKDLSQAIGLKVKLNVKGKAGALTLYYNDLDQLDDIIKRIKS
ncbi:MAG: ParB/RepB/Spo0J family partition protein [Alphaproteobacteria bacterium]|nr:ParB/RepB/Spo0J family partition protein [Alphaproteobacteria bacterium]